MRQVGQGKNRKRRVAKRRVKSTAAPAVVSLDTPANPFAAWRANLEERWERWRRPIKRELDAARRTHGGIFGAVVLICLRVAVTIALPFLVLVRGAVWLYLRHAIPTWPALTGSAVATLLLLTLYGALVSSRLTGRARLGVIAKWVAGPLVLGYCAYALFYVSRVNAKDDAVRSVYTATHPFLRLALSTLILADRHVVITDLARLPDDYRRMGLAVNQRSLHYRQDDGWVHAVDLRVRGPFTSWLVEGYFRAMGFESQRHVGTADHLHIWLPLEG
jgi:hypothetical protein